jgi:peptidyl-prolyl cis-trans isomerase B (cyclophilin B)
MKRTTAWRYFSGFLLMVLVIGMLALAPGCSNTDKNTDGNAAGTNTGTNTGTNAGANGSSTPATGENPQVKITMEDGGTILLELDSQAAPRTVENFLGLVEQGFYDGLTFHRIIPGFMIQGGDPNGDGSGDAGQTIKGEFASNGVDNPISHKRGVISMARSQALDSASCQFFITNADSSHLDGKYAAFGFVLEGMDVVDRISAVETDAGDRPLTPVVIKSIEVVNS